MSCWSVTNKLVRPRRKFSSESEESGAEQELNGLAEGEDAMTDEEGDGRAGTVRLESASRHQKQANCKREGRT